MQVLRQSTAATVVLGAFVDSTDGVTAETGLTISQADIRLSKNGAAFAQTNNVAGATHMENGYYSVPLDTTDTAAVGRLTVAVSESGALPVWREYHVVEENVYDATFAASAALGTDVASILTDTGTTLDNKIDTLDTVADAIKAKTDSLTFTTAGKADANLTHVNEVEVGGAGVSGDEWGPA